MEETKKPDYTDFDWGFLIQDRVKKWKEMLVLVHEAGWQTVPLRSSGGFTSQLMILPVHEQKRGMIIVCAGGGFKFKSANEAKPVAEYFHQAGLNAAILDYHTESDMGDQAAATGLDMKPEIRMEAGKDGLAAVRWLRACGDDLGIDPHHIAIGGFSAGGMLSGLTATLFDYGDPDAEDPLMQVSSRPDAALILYGAMALTGIGGAVGTYDCQQQVIACQTDVIRNIKSDCPPMFVFQTHKDDPRHALMFCYELANKGVPYEIHTFEEGPHGGGLYDGACEDSPSFKHTSRWAMLAAEWLEGKGFI